MDGYGRNSLLGNYGGGGGSYGLGSQPGLSSQQSIEDAAFAARVLELSSSAGGMIGGGGGGGGGNSYGQQQQYDSHSQQDMMR